MKKYFLIFFMIVGAGDFLYGILATDRISIVMGAVILILSIYIARRKNPDDDATGRSAE